MSTTGKSESPGRDEKKEKRDVSVSLDSSEEDTYNSFQLLQTTKNITEKRLLNPEISKEDPQSIELSDLSEEELVKPPPKVVAKGVQKHVLNPEKILTNVQKKDGSTVQQFFNSTIIHKKEGKTGKNILVPVEKKLQSVEKQNSKEPKKHQSDPIAPKNLPPIRQLQKNTFINLQQQQQQQPPPPPSPPQPQPPQPQQLQPQQPQQQQKQKQQKKPVLLSKKRKGSDSDSPISQEVSDESQPVFLKKPKFSSRKERAEKIENVIKEMATTTGYSPVVVAHALYVNSGSVPIAKDFLMNGGDVSKWNIFQKPWTLQEDSQIMENKNSVAYRTILELRDRGSVESRQAYLLDYESDP